MDMEQLSMFDTEAVYDPLASRMRPEDLDEFAGQTNLLGKGKLLRQLIEQDRIPSMIFWGPPGVGKTTLAGIIAKRTHAEFVNFSAVTSGIKEIREVMAQAEGRRRMGGKTVLFVDEIHRFNKAQQDAFLPFVEKGSIILIGATTENPSFEINSALLSRCRVFVLHSLSNEELVQLIRRALTSPKGLGYLKVDISSEMIEKIAAFANGDARTALNVLEMAVANGEITGEKTIVTIDTLMQCIGKKSLLYDKKGEEHYNLISALHKSMRNSDPDAGGRRGSPLRGKKAGSVCQRGYRDGRQQRPSSGCGRLSGLPFSGNARVQCPFKPCGHLPVHRAQEQFRLYGL